MAQFDNYHDFWLHYLRQHAKPATRWLHLAGTLSGLALVIWCLTGGPLWLPPVAIAVGYGFAWLSHFFVEGNRPATFGHPLWSLGSDFRMAALMLTGRLEGELRRAGISRP